MIYNVEEIKVPLEVFTTDSWQRGYKRKISKSKINGAWMSTERN